MQKYSETLKRSILFSGIDETEMNSMLGCLDARTEKFRKNDYMLRVGDSPDKIGILLSGSAFVV